MHLKTSLRYLEDHWDEKIVRILDQPELLCYRSNLLGSDLRITNFGGGNTSSKILQTDPLSERQEEVLWIKGSGGDLGSIKLAGLAALYSEKLRGLEHKYRGADYEDEMVEMYPLCAFGKNSVAASIDTPLHGFLPFPHIDQSTTVGNFAIQLTTLDGDYADGVGVSPGAVAKRASVMAAQSMGNEINGA
jgi:rhamnose utilization protein RhaD (predicted bifunctional aldolase and dehydrogenase)